MSQKGGGEGRQAREGERISVESVASEERQQTASVR